MQELTHDEINMISGAAEQWLNQISAGMAAASVVSAGLAAVPTPASPGLAGFSVMTGLMSAAAAYLSGRFD